MKRATILKVLAGTLVLTLVVSAFPLAQVALMAAEDRAAAEGLAARDDGRADVPSIGDLPFVSGGIGSRPNATTGDAPVGTDGTSSRPTPDMLASPARVDASSSVLLSQVMGAAEFMGYKVAVPELPVGQIDDVQPLRAAIIAWIAATGSVVPPDELAGQLARADAMPMPLQRDIALLLLSTIQATSLQKAALGKLTPEQLAWIYTHPELADDLARGINTPETRLLALMASNVDMAKSIEATLLLLAAVEATRGTFADHQAQQALKALDTAEVDATTKAMLTAILTADPTASDADKVRMAAKLVALGAGFDAPASIPAPSFNDALNALMAASAQTPAPTALLDIQTRAAALPNDLQGAIARLILAEANAINAASPRGLTPTSQERALAAVLIATADAMPVLEKYNLFWRDAPDALRVGEWTPGARIGWAAHHAALVVSSRGGLVDVARASAILNGHAVPALPHIEVLTFIEAYKGVLAQGGITADAQTLAAVQTASAQLDPAVRDAAAILMSGTIESTRLQSIAFAGLSPAEADLLRYRSFGLDELYAKPQLTNDELDRLTAASAFSSRVDADALAQSAAVAALAMQMAKDMLEGRNAFSTQGSATPVETGLRGFFSRLLPWSTATAQADPNCNDLLTGIVSTCGEDVILRLGLPLVEGMTPAERNAISAMPGYVDDIAGSGNYTCDERLCVIYAYDFRDPDRPAPRDGQRHDTTGGEISNDLLLITGSEGSRHMPQTATRRVCPSLVGTVVGDSRFGVLGVRGLTQVAHAGYVPTPVSSQCKYEVAYRYGAPTISLDLGGDDTYIHPVAMVPINATIPVSLHLDMGGADVYADPTALIDPYSPQVLVLGTSIGHPSVASAPHGGVAIAVDVEGTDIYQTQSMSQGYARLGFALLADLGQTDDTYTAGRLSQGAASDTFTLGAGVLLDFAGSDSYYAETGQGYGLGGILLDMGGKDGYTTEHAPNGAPLLGQLNIVPGGNVTTLTQRGDNRVWLDGPGTLSAGLGIDTEVLVSGGQSDQDGFPDFAEFLVGTDPYSDSDSPLTRPTGRTDSFLLDTDGDGYPDYIERILSTDPENPLSYPAGFPSGPGIVIPGEIYDVLVQQQLDKTLGMQGNVLDPFGAGSSQSEGMKGSDKILDLRLPLQDAGTVEFACTGEFFFNATTPLGLTEGTNLFEADGGGFGNSSLAGRRDPSSNSATRDPQTGAIIERCLYVGYEPTSPGEGRATVPAATGVNPQLNRSNEFAFRMPAGILAIGDVVSTNYADDYFVVIDLGGNDHFSGSPGGALPVVTTPDDPAEQTTRANFLAPSLVINIDLRDVPGALVASSGGADIYANATRDYSQGSFYGLLVDNAGDDSYLARDGSQGSLGGILLDLAGNDRYVARDLSQGAGLAGGPLQPTGTADGADRAADRSDLPGGGNATGDELFAQPIGLRRVHTGMLLDLGDHAVQTFEARSHSQGFARGFANAEITARNAPHARGLLVSLSGTDVYTGTGRNMQGVGGIDGIGILLDREGSDFYFANGFISHGATISQVIGTGDVLPSSPLPHPGASGILIDLGGNDQYKFPDSRTNARQQTTTITRAESASSQRAGRIYTDVGLHIDTTLDATNPEAFVAGIGGSGSGSVGNDQFAIDLPSARLAIGSESDTNFTREYAFAVDLGGHNEYRYSAAGLISDYLAQAEPNGNPGNVQTNVAPGAVSAPLNLFPVTFLLDAGSGTSTYTANHGIVQGAGYFGIGILADLGGYDNFSALSKPIPSLASKWAPWASPPTIDANIGTEWNGVPKQPITLASLRDDRYTHDWSVRIANDNRSIYIAIEGVTTGRDTNERYKDTLTLDLDMGRRHNTFDKEFDRTGLDEVTFTFTSTGACNASDYGYRLNNQAGFIRSNWGEDHPSDRLVKSFQADCRTTPEGKVFFELRKDLVDTEIPSKHLDLNYCWDDDVGFGFDANGTCRFPEIELGMFLKFSDTAAGYIATPAQQGVTPTTAESAGVFTWPAGAVNDELSYQSFRNKNLSDEMAKWAAIGLANGKDGIVPIAALAPSLAQGVGLAGIGVLAMLGNGFAEGQLIAASHAQGFAGYGGLGALFDAGGSDHYRGTERVQGAAQNMSSAIFIDLEGNDVYEVERHAYGWVPVNEPGTFGVAQAIFMDLGGDDKYVWRSTDVTATADQARRARHAINDADPAYGNNIAWVQNDNGFGADFIVTQAVRDSLSGVLASQLYGQLNDSVRVLMTHYDPDATTKYANGCTDRRVDTSNGLDSGKFQASGMVCFHATIDMRNGSINRTANPAFTQLRALAGTNADLIAQIDAAEALVRNPGGGAVDVRSVDFMIDRERAATALEISRRTSITNTTWTAPIDLSKYADGVVRVKALPIFVAEVEDRGLLLFGADVGNAEEDRPGSRSLIIDNAPTVGIGLTPLYTGRANSTFSPYAYGSLQQLNVTWNVSHDASEDKLDAANGWSVPAKNQSFPCQGGVIPTEAEPKLCHQLPLFLLSADSGPMTTQAGGNAVATPNNLELETIDGAPFAGRTELLNAPLRINANQSFHLAIPSRVALLPIALNTEIKIEVRDKANVAIAAEPGKTWSIGGGFFTGAASPVPGVDQLGSLLTVAREPLNNAARTIEEQLKVLDGPVIYNEIKLVQNTLCTPQTSAQCQLIRGDPNITLINRPCSANEPLAQSNLVPFLAWYAVQSVDRRSFFKPDSRPLNQAWPVPATPFPAIPNDPGTRICDPISDKLNSTADQFSGVTLGGLPVPVPEVPTLQGGIDGFHFTDFWFDANMTLPPAAVAAGVRNDSGELFIPAGYRLVLTFGLSTGASGGGTGAAISDQLAVIADIIQGTGALPGPGNCTGDVVCNFQESLDINGTVAGPSSPLRDRTTLGNIDNLVSGQAGIPAAFYFVKTGERFDNESRLEIRIPAEATTTASITINDPDTNEVVASLLDTMTVQGDVAGSPRRGGAVYDPTYWDDKDVRVVFWTANGLSDRWTVHNLSYRDNALEGRYNVTVTATDGRGQLNTKVDSVLIDRTPPQTFVKTAAFLGAATLAEGGRIGVEWQPIDVSSGANPKPGSGIAFVNVWTRAGSAGDLGDITTWTDHGRFPAGANDKLISKGADDTHYILTVGVDRAGNVEGTTNELTLEDALKAGFAAKIARGANTIDGLGYRKVTVDIVAPRFSSFSTAGGHLANFEGADFTFVRAGQELSLAICARDGETSIFTDANGVETGVKLSLAHEDPLTQHLYTGTYVARNTGACPNGVNGTLYTSDTWPTENADQTRFPEGIYAALFTVKDQAGNEIAVPAGNIILDHRSPVVKIEPPVLPTGQTAVKPGDVVKIRLTAEDTFGVDEEKITVDASVFANNATALKPRPARVNGVIYQEVQFTVDRVNLNNAAYDVIVRVPDLAGNVTTTKVPISVNARAFEFVPDTLHITNVTHNSFVVHWNTTDPTSALVKFGTTTLALNGRTTLDANASKSHAVKVEGLKPSTRYHLRVVSASTGGFSKESEIIETVTTTALFLKPLTPVKGDKVSGLVKVAFEGGLLDSTDFVTYTLEVRDAAAKPWTFVTTATRQGELHELRWNSTRYLDGTGYELRLTAEAAKDVASFVIGPLTSDNTPPSVLVLSPLLATNDTTPRVMAETSDLLSGFPKGPAELLIDGMPVTGNLTIEKQPDERLRIIYDVPEPLTAGMRLFELRVQDVAGNIAKEAWKVAIDGDPPVITVNPIRYAPGTAAAKTGGTVTLNLTAKDLSGVSMVVADATSLGGPEELRLVKIVNTNEWQGTMTVSATDPQGVKSIAVRAVDLAGNVRDLTIPVPLDNVAPKLEATSLVAIDYTRALIKLGSDEPILVTTTATAPLSPAVSVSTPVLEKSPTVAIEGLLPSRTYSYEMAVTDGGGNEVPIRGTFATKDDTEPPTSVGPLSVLDLLNGTLRLSWDKAQDNVAVAHYRIYRSEDGVTFRIIAEVQNATYDDVHLPYEKPYVYKVAAVDHGSNEGPIDNTLRASATAVPRLSSGVVSPTAGTVTTPFRYVIVYTSPGGVPPAYVRIILDGVPQTMTIVETADAESVKAGITYSYETRLAPHKRDAPHTYAFEASDGRYTARFPEDGSLMRGPLVSGDALAGGDVGGLASFAQRVPLGGVAGMSIALVAAVAIATALSRKKKEGSK